MKKILLIEDNPDVRENTSEILTLAGYDVKTAPNGKVGVDLAQKEQPDLIVCDIMMPELDGYGVLHILSKKEETAGIPFIFLTAKTEKTDIRKGMNLGADDYLTKPFDDTDLLNAIEARLRKTAMQQKLYESTAEGLDTFIRDARQVLNMKELGKDKKVKAFKKKSEVFAEGDAPLNVYYVKSGSVKIFKSHPDGKELITALVNANDFFGFEPILEGTTYQESAVALQDTELTVIPKSDFLSLFQSPDVSASFISLLCKKVADKENQLVNLAYNSVRQRTAEALLKTIQLKDVKENIQISREDLAKMVGTAAESVIRVLSDFKDEGLIEIEGGKIRIKSQTKLEKVVRWNVAR
ncbi:response regulator [Chryseolinea lacunae]|uniref:Response regulator n=1 Tax=Chryseolinea lacunae TaxID=2801331 RepID=A0ABS1KMQ7_9BACT|nr:response regulator [Chryseolinea lacunae]MBL0740503.1 response regulator [Chryseolinea lacunae]